MPIDLEPILDIVDGYEERKENARAWYIKNNIPAHEHMFSHLASLSVDDSSRAFEALRPLVARVRELERQAQVLAVAVSEYQRCKTCIVRRSCPNDAKGGPQEDCVVAILKWAEQAAKEPVK